MLYNMAGWHHHHHQCAVCNVKRFGSLLATNCVPTWPFSKCGASYITACMVQSGKQISS
jgi:hypothetical protein